MRFLASSLLFAAVVSTHTLLGCKTEKKKTESTTEVKKDKQPEQKGSTPSDPKTSSASSNTVPSPASPEKLTGLEATLAIDDVKEYDSLLSIESVIDKAAAETLKLAVMAQEFNAAHDWLLKTGSVLSSKETSQLTNDAKKAHLLKLMAPWMETHSAKLLYRVARLADKRTTISELAGCDASTALGDEAFILMQSVAALAAKITPAPVTTNRLTAPAIVANQVAATSETVVFKAPNAILTIDAADVSPIIDALAAIRDVISTTVLAGLSNNRHVNKAELEKLPLPVLPTVSAVTKNCPETGFQRILNAASFQKVDTVAMRAGGATEAAIQAALNVQLQAGIVEAQQRTDAAKRNKVFRLDGEGLQAIRNHKLSLDKTSNKAE